MNLRTTVGLCLSIALLASNTPAFAATPMQNQGASYIEYEYVNGEILASEILHTSTVSAEEAGAIVEFDYNKAVSEFAAHLISNNPNMTNETAVSVARQLASNVEAAETAALNNTSINSQSLDTASTSLVIVPIGKVENDAFVAVNADATLNFPENASSAYSYIPDSRTTIISEGWSVNPYIETHTRWARYTVSWYGLDNYKTPVAGTYSQSEEASTEIDLGFSTNSTLTASDALKFGLTVTKKYTQTQSVKKGFTLEVPGWTKTVVRPYIYYYVDDYTGVYRYYCYNSYDQTYFYVTETRTATNSYHIESSIRTWSRFNEDKDPAAISPVPPTEWEW